jgi:glycosyltransferase involved in cell wall biosynthesis
LPVIAHQHPVMEYVLGGQGYLGDLRRSGELAEILAGLLSQSSCEERMIRRWKSVRERFNWPVLAPRYAAMFSAAAGGGSLAATDLWEGASTSK